MKQGSFETYHAPEWTRLESILDTLESRRKRQEGLSDEDYLQFSQLYRRICHYHSLARERKYSSTLVDMLDDLVARGYRLQYRREHRFRQQFTRFFVLDFPQLIRREWRYFLVANILFYLPALILAIAILRFPELVYSIVDPQQAAQMESMYDPANRVLGEARDSGSNWMMFGFYINNNIGISFRCFATGILYGIGSIFFVLYNGLLLGAVSGHLINMGFTQTFFSFVIAHGAFELTAINISGAAGLKLGMALLSPGNLTRRESLKKNGLIAIQMMYGVVAMLLVAAFIEAFWSSNNVFEYWQKYLVGFLTWSLVCIYFGFAGRRRGSE